MGFWDFLGNEFADLNRYRNDTGTPFSNNSPVWSANAPWKSSSPGDASQDVVNSTIEAVSGELDAYERYQDRLEDYNKEASRVDYERTRELYQLSADLQRELRKTQFQDTVQDLKKAGINPAVYFANNGSPGFSSAVSGSSVSTGAFTSNNADKVSQLGSAIGSILSAIAANKNADTAVLRSVLSMAGSIFNVGISKSSSSSLIGNISDNSSRNKIGF